MTSERKIEKSVCDYAVKKGWQQYKFVSPNNRGVPDRVFMKDGVTFFIEFKTKNGTLTALQEWTQEKFVRNGFRVYVVRNIGDGEKVINVETGKLTRLSEGRDFLYQAEAQMQSIPLNGIREDRDDTYSGF